MLTLKYIEREEKKNFNGLLTILNNKTRLRVVVLEDPFWFNSKLGLRGLR